MNFSRETIGELTEELFDDRLERKVFRNLLVDKKSLPTELGYAVQKNLMEKTLKLNDDVIAGYKIGLTSKRMQELLGISEPIYGSILRSRIKQNGDIVSVKEFLNLGVECEIAVKLGRELNKKEGPFDLGAVAKAIDSIYPAIELIDDRRADYKSVNVGSLIADNSWNAGLILGNPVEAMPDAINALKGVLKVNGEVIDYGFSGDVLGHPLAPVVWLANKVESGLPAGTLISTGSIITTYFPKPSERCEFSIDNFGSVNINCVA